MTGCTQGRRRRPRGAAPLLVLLLTLLPVTACSSQTPGPDRPHSTSGVVAVGADATRSRAAELQAGLTHLLVERVLVTAAARGAVDPAQQADAVAALDQATVALADLLASTYPAARDALLIVLRNVDRRELEHAAAVRAGAAAAALESLTAAQSELADTLLRVVSGLAAPALRTRLDGDLTAQLQVGGPDPYAQLRVAARRASATARLLSGAVAEDLDLGPISGRAVGLRAELTGLLTEHVLLAGAVAGEPAGDVRAGAVRALQANGADLTALLGRAYPALAGDFRPSWARHVARVVDLASRPSAARQRIVLAYPAELGALLERHVGGLPPGTTAAEVEPLVRQLATAVEVSARHDADAQVVLRTAAAAVPVPSALLAAAIAQDRRYS